MNAEFVKYQEYKKLFDVKESKALALYEELLKNSVDYNIECSHKILFNNIYSQRVNVWYHTDFRDSLNLIFTFFRTINRLESVRLDFSILERLIARFDMYKVQHVICGIDYREKIWESRVKLWFNIVNYPEKIKEVLALYGNSKEVKQWIHNHNLLFGIDMYFNGNAKLKIYPAYYESEFHILERKFSKKIDLLIKKCSLIHLSFSENSDKIIHFHPKNPEEIINSINNAEVYLINQKYKKKKYSLQVISISEQDILSDNIREINMYY